MHVSHGPSASTLVDGPAGFVTGFSLRPDELAHVRGLIEAQWLDRLRRLYPTEVDGFAERGLDRYHERCARIDHTTTWCKSARILPAAAAGTVREMSLLRALEDHFGAFVISDEDRVGHEEMVWRLVRPGEPTDVGPLHADEWFVVLADEPMPPGRRVKVWIAIACEPGRNGLTVVPGSHRRTWQYHGVWRHGRMKPELDEDVTMLDTQLVSTRPGDAVVFHHDLLHGGVVNEGERMRVSLEFTMCIPSRVIHHARSDYRARSSGPLECGSAAAAWPTSLAALAR